MILASAAVLTLYAQTVKVYHVPRYNDYEDYAPGIAANRFGDIMVAYANMKVGPLYYLKKHGSATWIGPSQLPGLPFAPGWGDAVALVNVVSSRDGVFHISWNMNDAGGHTGIHYISYDPTTDTWSSHQHLVWDQAGFTKPHMAYNHKLNEIVIAYSLTWGIDKSIYLVTKKADGWTAPRIITEPVLAETEPYVCFDDQGRAFVTFKMDRKVGPGPDDWELAIQVQMLDSASNYSQLWLDIVTWEVPGREYFPAIAVLKNKGIITYVWKEAMAYYYIPFEIKDSEVQFEWQKVKDWHLTGAPIHPHYKFQSHVLSYTDEFLFIFKAPNHSIRMIRYKDGIWLGDQEVDISQGATSITNYPFNVWAEPSIGILSAWSPSDQVGPVSFSIYDYKKSVVSPPVNLKLVHANERSLFHQYYLNELSWENDLLNTEQGVTIGKYNLYRRAKGTVNYSKIAEVNPQSGEMTYVDKNGVGVTNTFDYAVSAVDDKGNESLYSEAIGDGR